MRPMKDEDKNGEEEICAKKTPATATTQLLYLGFNERLSQDARGDFIFKLSSVS